MNPPDPRGGAADKAQRYELASQPRDDSGPVFAEPWEAQAFALAVRLHEAGCFSWKEWADTLAAELRTAERQGRPDDGTRYYEHWLAALERLVKEKGLVQPDALRGRRDAWEQAYRNTPHGKPVTLAAAADHAEG